MPVTEKSVVFEGFTTPGPETVRVKTKAVEAWNEPAFVEQIAAAGFPGCAVKISLLAVPALILKVALVAPVSPVADAVSLYPVPVLSIERSLKLTTPPAL